MSNGWIEIAREAAKLPALLTEIYGDLLKPGVKQVGKALGTIAGLGNTVLWPLALANERARLTLERNFEKYRAQLQDIPQEEITEVSPEVGVPIAEKLSYVSDEELSELYINLLAKASVKATTKFAHPSFVAIINNLSPDEALVLKALKKRGALPFVTARLTDKEKDTWGALGDLLTGVESEIPLAYPNNIVAYFSNLEGLGIIQVRRDIVIARPELYDALEAKYRPEFGGLISDKAKEEVRFARGKIEVTPFGQMFIKACLTKVKEI